MKIISRKSIKFYHSTYFQMIQFLVPTISCNEKVKLSVNLIIILFTGRQQPVYLNQLSIVDKWQALESFTILCTILWPTFFLITEFIDFCFNLDDISINKIRIKIYITGFPSKYDDFTIMISPLISNFK